MDIIIPLILLIILSGIFSGSEIAFFTLSNSKLDSIKSSNPLLGSIISKLKDSADKLLITILIGNNIVNILMSSLATYIATERFGSAGVGIATGIITLLILTFGEILPKLIATSNPVMFTKYTTYFLYILSLILYPFVIIFGYLNKVFMFVLRIKREKVNLENELISLAKTAQTKGDITGFEKDLVLNGLINSSRSVKEILTKIEDVYWVDGDISVSTFINNYTHKHSRIPLYINAKPSDKYLYVRDILKINTKDWNKTIIKYSRDMLVIDSTLSLITVFEIMEESNCHIANVYENDRCIGIVTLEDIIEDLLRDINDETD